MSNLDLHPDAAPEWLTPLIAHLDVERAGALTAHPDIRAVDTFRRHVVSLARPIESPARRSAVLVGIHGGHPDVASVLLTHRNPNLRSHAGQMAFPGGRIDPTDASAVDAALREANEETGIDRRAVVPLAQLPEIAVGPSANPVDAVVGYLGDDPTPPRAVVNSPEETDDVFYAPVSTLIDPANRLMVGFKSWRGPAFSINGYLVWGFTGSLLSAVLDESGVSMPWDRRSTTSLLEALRNSRNNESLLSRNK